MTKDAKGICRQKFKKTPRYPKRTLKYTFFFLNYFLCFAHPESTSNRNVPGIQEALLLKKETSKQTNKNKKLLNAERRTERRGRVYNNNIKKNPVIQRISNGSSYRNI